MYKTIEVLLLFFTSQVALNSQTTFSKVFNNFHTNTDAQSITSDDKGNYYILENIFGLKGLELLKINSEGDTLYTKLIIDSIYQLQAGLILFDNDLIYLSGTRWLKNQNKRFEGYFYQLDSLGNIMHSTAFNGPEDYFINSMISLSDGNLLLCGEKSDTAIRKWDIALIKISKNGTEIWNKRYSKYLDDVGLTAIELQDGSLLIGGFVDISFQNFNNYLIKTDASGKKIWDKIWNYQLSCGISGLSQLKSGDIVFTGECIDSSDFPRAFIGKMDGNGAILWQRYYGGWGAFFCQRNPLELEEGCILTIGTGQDTSNHTLLTHGMMMLFSETGDSLWTGLYNHHWGPEQFYDFTKTPTGYICVGYAVDSILKQSAWIVKIENYSIPPCVNPVNTEDNLNLQKSLHIYPNPAYEYFNISIPDIYKNTILNIFDINGHVVLRHNNLSSGNYQIQMQNLPRGVYFVTTISNGKVIFSQKLISI